MMYWFRPAPPGYAAILVIWGVSALAVVALNVSKGQRLNAIQAVNTVESLQAAQLASSGVDLAIYHLQSGAGEGATQGTQNWTLHLEGTGDIAVHAVPAQAFLDLNHAPEDWLVRVMSAAGLTPARAEEIAARIVEARSAVASRNPSSAAFHDVYNLRTQGVVNDEELQRLMPYLTVYNGTSRVHMQSAPELILRSIPGLDAAAGARLAATRDLKSMQNDRHTSLSARFTAKAGPVFHLVLEGRAESGAVAHRAAIVSQFPKGHTVLAYGEAWEPLQ